MAKSDIISRLRLDSGEFDSKIKRAGQELLAYSEHCKKVSLQMGFANKDAVDFAKALGSMQTTSQTARGKINELSEALVNAKVMFKNMTDAERNSEFGRNLATSLDQLKSRLQSAKKDLADVQQELSGSKFGQFGSILDGIGQKMGLNANITELLTSKTALMSAGIGAAGAIVGKAAQEWAKYNAELAKQDQITTVTTGLKGAGSDRMTDQARALTDTYGVDFREAINAANTLMTQFGQTGEQAMSLISDGMQGMIQGDGPKLLSMIQQYAPAFRDAGVTASQLVAVIQNSEGGIFTDQNMNAIVMGIKNIRLMTKATSDALAQLGIDGQKMSQQLRDGSLTIFDALKQVATRIQGVNSNSQAAGEVMQQVFGRQGAMAGTKLGEAIATLNTNLEETKRQTGEVGDAYNDLYNANVKLNGAIRDCFEYDGWDQMATGIKANLVSALASVLNYLGKIKGALGGFSVNQQQGETRNGGGQFIDRAVDRLRGGNTPGKQQIYTRQIQAYSGKILDINDQIRQIQEKAAQDMDGNMAVVYEKQIRNLENRKQAIQRNMAEYNKRAQAVLNGTDTKSVPITNPVTTVTTPKTTSTHKSTPQETAANKVKEAERTYAETLMKNSIRLEAGMDTTLEYKKRELSAQERLFDAYNDAYATYQDPAYKKASTEAAEKIKTLAGEVKAASDAQEAARKSARELDAAQRKLADAQQKLAEARATGSATAVYQAQKNVDKQQDVVNRLQNPTLPAKPQQPTGFEALKQTVQAEIKFDQMKVDETALHTLLQTALQNGLDNLTPDYAGLQERIAKGIDIPDSTWEELTNEINEKLKDLGIEPIQIPVETVGKDVKAITQAARTTAEVVGSIGDAFNAIEDPAAKVMGTVMQAIASVALGYAQATVQATTMGPWAWVAFAATGLATMLSTISAIHSATGYAQGGIVKGNSYSGDNIYGGPDAMVNAGELVLNKAQQNALANELQGNGMQNMRLRTEVSGRNLIVVIENDLKARGKGQLATFKG